jgi:methionine synthase II (cobalamin-independent)
MTLKIKTSHNSESTVLENVKSFEFKSSKVNNLLDITYNNNDTQFIFGVMTIKYNEVEE